MGAKYIKRIGSSFRTTSNQNSPKVSALRSRAVRPLLSPKSSDPPEQRRRSRKIIQFTKPRHRCPHNTQSSEPSSNFPPPVFLTAPRILQDVPLVLAQLIIQNFPQSNGGLQKVNDTRGAKGSHNSIARTREAPEKTWGTHTFLKAERAKPPSKRQSTGASVTE